MKKRHVLFSARAKNRLQNLLSYLEENWSIKAQSSFLKKLDNSISAITNFPGLYPVSREKQGVHKAVVTKQITLFYRFDDSKIEIITLFDTRQDPEKLGDDIK
jgi:plasmid stabilization system protein ParE